MSPRFGRSGNEAGRPGDAGDDELGRVLAAALARAAGVKPDTVRVDVEGLRAEDLSLPLDLHLAALESAEAPMAAETGVPGRSDGPGEDVAAEAEVAGVGTSAEGEDEVEAADDDEEAGPVDLDAQAEAAADFLEGLLDAFDLDGDLQLRVLEDRAEVEITDAGEGVLIGRRGQTLDAIQELTRSALQRRFQQRSHVVVDVDGYRARRVERLLERTDEAIAEVRETGEAQRLEPMDAFERKVVHQRVAEAGGLVSNSFGREPARRVIIERA